MSTPSHEDEFSRLDQLTDIARALSGERDLTKLLELIMRSAKQVTKADGGTLYRASEDGQTLTFDLVFNATLGLHYGGTSGKQANFPPMPLYRPDGKPNDSSVVAHCALTRKSVRIDDAYTVEGFDFVGARRFDAENNYRSQSFLTVPMMTHDDQLIGVLQLINARDDLYATVPFSEQDQRFIEALAAQAAIALENQMLLDRLETLFFSFINLINVAIDEKSPHTSGHCQRVPALTMMLADAAAATDAGPLATFSMDERDRRELLIAGLLHDCGKIVTPVHVMDKGTKLQTLFDRIEMVDARFEVVRRDAEIAALRARLAGGDTATIDRVLAAELESLAADQKFLRTANVGQEKMADADIARVQAIAARTWQHSDGSMRPFLSDDEARNLAIQYGTLTQDERTIINNHIVVTIKMLESLPWPPHMRRIPEYAGGHHERMDGKGYPRGLTRDQMPVQARVMGIADIFEALTADDRPYKAAKTLNESLNILGYMAKGGHVDSDLFDIFVRKKVYLEFAHKFLSPDQIDEVDEAKVPGYIP